MRRTLGESRSVIGKKHAVICVDSHEITPAPHWRNCQVVVVIAPTLGARFSQFFVTMAQGDTGASPSDGVERFFMVLEGEVSLVIAGEGRTLGREHYALVPAGVAHEIRASSAARLLVLERVYVPLRGEDAAQLVVSSVAEKAPLPMTTSAGLSVRQLIPADLRFDCAVNIMEFVPGASLPYVETHHVEHGLLMLDGGGIYRLDDDWYPVERGDVIWMGPFCAQWFGALGSGNARYLIYKDWNREALAP